MLCWFLLDSKVNQLYVSLLFFFLIYLFRFGHTAARGILIPQPGIKPTLPAVEMRSLNNCTAGEEIHLLKKKKKIITV